MADFVAAYNKSRFWHGIKSGDTKTLATGGLLISMSSCVPGSSNPDMRESSGGIICLGVSYKASVCYGTPVRVFLNADRAKALAGNSVQGKNEGSYYPGNDRIWSDNGNSGAVSTWADIPADCIWDDTLTKLCRQPATDDKCATIFRNIASFDPDLPTSVAALQAMMLTAVTNGALKDTVDEELVNPILSTLPSPKASHQTTAMDAKRKSKKGCAIM